jgi:hypothetical protein
MWGLTCHYLEKAGTIVGVRAVALLAGLPEDFKKSCYLGRSQVPVPAAWVDKLLPGIFTLKQQLRTQASTGQQQARAGLLRAGADRHAHPAG